MKRKHVQNVIKFYPIFYNDLKNPYPNQNSTIKIFILNMGLEY